MDEKAWLTERFEDHRARLRAVAYQMLGSFNDADDAVQEAWLRVSRAGAGNVENVGGWLTTVVARVCLNMLRTRERRREESFDVHLPDPVVSRADEGDPEQEALLADSVGLALLVVLDTLKPAERLAFVLHDMFAVPFDQIAPMVERSPAAARQLASRARHRVRGAAPDPDSDLTRQREVVDAYFAAVRDGDLDALVAVLAPDVVLRADGGTARARHTSVIRGARDVAAQAAKATRLAPFVQPALINGTAGAVAIAGGRAFSIMAFTVAHGQIATIDVLVDPERLAHLDLEAFGITPSIVTAEGVTAEGRFRPDRPRPRK
ncbi:sigma-70 family RNA polymerase sigma factor [Actinobacteria bacterium YIM 96077]|uniref:RNA polymerase subunit sigma-70 n=1 Tax=Phytoactinopolyspora halophila TaxID=1981511 RepID=A0A329QNB1_9ACTN|nr:RNA polymerase sigma factor SigJ [Phytoactinopolyspora halophila]AYY15285.1 sigma-70 family RNA polymerase sigma factor [Actinobacteria bacterium YIM 96077]RAW13844.1 RNA polymerase subunit sigma-70 [Phytoactinopolyspora halophila]